MKLAPTPNAFKTRFKSFVASMAFERTIEFCHNIGIPPILKTDTVSAVKISTNEWDIQIWMLYV